MASEFVGLCPKCQRPLSNVHVRLFSGIKPDGVGEAPLVAYVCPLSGCQTIISVQLNQKFQSSGFEEWIALGIKHADPKSLPSITLEQARKLSEKEKESDK